MQRGLATITSRQSANSLRAAQGELATVGIDLRLVHVTHKFSRRLWRYWRAPFEDLRAIVLLAFGSNDFVILNAVETLMRRPRLLRVLLAVAAARGVRIYARWGSCRWLLEEKREQVGDSAFNMWCSRLARDDVQHLVLTPQAAADLVAATGISRSHVIWNSNAISDRYLSHEPVNDPPIVVNVATVQPRKGPDLFVETAVEVCSAHPTVRFVWVGGFATRELEQQIAAAGLHDRVEFIGPAFPPWEWLQRASVVFFPSRSEAFGLAVAEAMACSRTVCAFEGTGAADAVGDTGIVVPHFDTAEAAARILAVLGKAPEDRVHREARDRYEELFSPPVFAERLAQLLSR